MTAEQAKEFGLIDKVIKSRDEAEGMLATPAKPDPGLAGAPPEPSWHGLDLRTRARSWSGGLVLAVACA